MTIATSDELHEAREALLEANHVLAKVDKKDIIEIKSFSKPPPLVKMVMEAVCILFKVPPEWDSARRLLSDTFFVKRLMNFDKDSVDNATLSNLTPYLDSELFKAHEVTRQSVAAGSIVLWVTAMNKYGRMRAIIQPQIDNLEQEKKNLKGVVSSYEEICRELERLTQKLKDVTEETTGIKHEKETAEAKLREASKNTGKVSNLVETFKEERNKFQKLTIEVYYTPSFCPFYI